jgi:uncharacterized protein
VTERLLIWVLKGLRAGDTAQAMELALQLGGRVEAKQLQFNASHIIPNFLLGGRVLHLTTDAKNLLRPPWPDVVVATGRRTAAVAVWIKQQSSGKTKLLQIGRPRMALSAFDVVVTTPQYGLPEAENLVTMMLPFASPKAVPPDQLLMFEEAWRELPKPWLLAVVGGQKFPLRLGKVDLQQFGQALQKRVATKSGSVVLLDSPRSPTGALDVVARQLQIPHRKLERGAGPNPYQAALKLCDELVVTGDSVSMVTEMLLTGKPTSIFRLSVSPFAVQWSAQNGVGAALARQGMISPPRDVDGFMQGLLDQGLVGNLADGKDALPQTNGAAEQSKALAQIKSVLKI